MPDVGAYEAKTHLSKLLERVASGEQFTITKHGTPIARLVPASPADQADPAQIIEELRAFRRRHTLGDLELKHLIEEDRR